MFSVKWKSRDFEKNGRDGTITYQVSKKEAMLVCKIETWAFGSCACFALSRFNDGYNFRYDAENIDKFFEFVCSLDEDWKPREFYFLLSKSQLAQDKLKFLYKHPNVKLRDVFSNKSHGPNKVYLFRYSASKDFKAFRKLKGMT
jgi:hypothetical protein